MEKNTTTSTKPNIPPKPIQAGSPQEGNFNVQKKSEANHSTSQSAEHNNVDDMDGNNAQKGKNQANSNASNNAISEDQWKTKVSSAKHQWNKLQQEELVATCGNRDQLSGLVQKRYAMNKLDADKQVKEFFSKH